ncbi:HAD family hydrolase [Streptomyces sp. NPDC006307]|uniref:HAD family hydrolase n=1 Tax=Streptomyces sp. NPDC006307 TaxID=3156748 RepID=UPI0033A9F677
MTVRDDVSGKLTRDRHSDGTGIDEPKSVRFLPVTRLALFDLDNTLIDRQTAVTDAVAALCLAHGYSTTIEQRLRSELADRAHPSDFARLCAAFDLTEPAERLWQEYVDLMAATVTCHPEVLNGLACLREAGWTIGIVTNGASDIQRTKLTAVGLADLVDGVAVSGDLEIRKPDRQLFELAATRCGKNLVGGWMTGDDPAGDIGGGREAGLRTIWLRGRPWPDGLPPADHDVDDVTDAINILLEETE